MKSFRRVLNAALLFSFLAITSFAREKPQQETPPPASKKITRVRQGGNITAKMLKVKVQPVYPKEARDQRIQGVVRLHAVLATDGSVAQLEVVSGHPVLVASALDAVRQWKYRPTLLNGEPVEVDTTIDIIFSFR